MRDDGLRTSDSQEFDEGFQSENCWWDFRQDHGCGLSTFWIKNIRASHQDNSAQVEDCKSLLSIHLGRVQCEVRYFISGEVRYICACVSLLGLLGLHGLHIWTRGPPTLGSPRDLVWCHMLRSKLGVVSLWCHLMGAIVMSLRIGDVHHFALQSVYDSVVGIPWDHFD